MEVVQEIASLVSILAATSLLPLLYFAVKDVKKFQESEIGKQNARLEELIKIREAQIEELMAKNQELETRLDEYRSFGIMHPTEDPANE